MSIPISMVADATKTATSDADAEQIIESIRAGEWRVPVEAIRELLNRTLSETNDLKGAKKAVASLKKELPAVMFSGTFNQRAAEHLNAHSGLLCADLDDLGERLTATRTLLLTSPHLWALFTSPTGNGLKAVFRVVSVADKHKGSFLAVEEYVQKLTGEKIDQSCKDVSRLCFVSHDPDAILNPKAVALAPLELPEKPIVRAAYSNGGTRQEIAQRILGPITWETDIKGYCPCPGQRLHTSGDGEKHCMVCLDGAPTVSCFHASCSGIISGINHELRSEIGKAELVKPSLSTISPAMKTMAACP